MKNRFEVIADQLPNLFMKGLGFFMLFFMLGVFSAQADITTGLVGEWLSGQNSGSIVNDVSGNGNSAVLSPATPAWTNTGALTFNGTNQYAGVVPTTGTLLNSVSSSFTFSAWVKVSGLPTNQGTSTVSGGILIRPGYHEGLYVNSTGTFSANIWNTSNSAFSVTSSAYATGSWHLLTMTVDDSAKTLTLYIDGNSAGSTSFTGTLATYTTSSNDGYDLYMGVADPNNSSYQWFFNGSIQDTRVYTRALSNSDVSELYKSPIISLSTDSTTYYTSPYNVTLTANVLTEAGDASISKVVFYCNYGASNQTQIAEMTQAASITANVDGTTTNTYQYVWDSVALGKYPLTAVVTDSNGNSNNSGAVNIWVTGNDLEGEWIYDQSSGTTATDASGNSNTGTFSSTKPTWVTGITTETGDALSFNGNSAITVTDSASLDTVGTNDQITISAWLKPSLINGNWQQIVSRGNWSLMINGNSFLSFLYNGSEIGPGYLLTVDNEWHLVTATYDGTTIRMYEDGVLMASFAGTALGNTLITISTAGQGYSVGDILTFSNTSTTATVSSINSSGGITSITLNGAIPSNTGTISLNGTSGNGTGASIRLNSTFYIGCDQFGYGRNYNGSIEDVRIYSRAFSQNDITNLYGKTPVSLRTDQLQYTSTPANAVLTAIAYPATGVTVSNIEFYSNNNGTVTDLGPGVLSSTAPNTYTFNWNNIPSGVYTITAVVTDNTNPQNTSKPTTIYVNTHVLNYSVNGSGNLQSLTYNGLQFYTSSSNQTGLYTGFYNANGNEVSTGQGFTKSYYYTDASDCNTILPSDWATVSPPSTNFVCQQNVFGTAGQAGSYSVSRLYSTPDDQTLKIDYYITNNDANDTMPSFSYEYFMELQTPGIWQGGWFAVGNNGTGSPVTFMSGPWGSMALFTDDYKKNSYFGDVWTITGPTYPNTTGPADYLWDFTNCSAPSPGADSSDTTCDAIAPNQTWHYASYIRFGASTDSVATLVPQTINSTPVGNAAFGNAYPYLLNWPDRRPIARWFIGGVQCIGPEDPRGWCNPNNQPFSTANGDISTLSSQANFSAYMLSKTQSVISTMNAQNPRPQSVLIWDLEGDEISQSFTYVGNPPQLVNMAPEMSAVADQMFALFKAAGYQIGMTLRPSNFQTGSTLPTTCNFNSNGNLSDVFVLTTPTTPGSTNITLAQGPSFYGANVCAGPSTVTINAAGTKYNGGDEITFSQSGKSIVTGWVSGTNSSGGITSISVDGTWDSSVGYPITLTSTGTNKSGTGASITISTSNIWTQPGYRAPGNQTITNIDGLNLYSVTVNNGGSGYSVGDQLNIVEPGGSRGIVTVTAVNAGAITGLSITNYGQAYSYTTANGITLTDITGSGTGATVNLTSNYPQITLANLSSLSNYNISILANLEGKVAYAHNRWGARVFYVDSTVYASGNSFNFKIWDQLEQDFPDCLFMPENQEPYYYEATAAYSSIEGYGETGVPTQATAMWPQSFTFVEAVDDVNVTPGESGSYFNTLESSVEAGNSLFDDTYDNGIDAIYKAAYTAAPSRIPSYTTVGYGLTVSSTGSGSGVVTGTIPINSGATDNQSVNVQEINCTSSTPAMCLAAFDQGTLVTLTATVNSGSSFNGWTVTGSSAGTCVGITNPCTLTISAATTVSASFIPSSTASFLNVATIGLGEVFVGQTDYCGIDGGPCSEMFSNGTSITLTATAATGYTFSGWSGACSGTGSCTVTMNPAQNVTANFVASKVNGECGAAAQTYLYNATSFGSNALCKSGTPNPSTVIFPEPGTLVHWTCVGSNNGFNSICSAKRNSRTIVKLL